MIKFKSGAMLLFYCDIIISLKTKDISKVSSPYFGDYIVLNGAIMREKSYIDWLDDCIKKALLIND